MELQVCAMPLCWLKRKTERWTKYYGLALKSFLKSRRWLITLWVYSFVDLAEVLFWPLCSPSILVPMSHLALPRTPTSPHHQSKGVKWPWTETSEIISQNMYLLYIINGFFHVFFTVKESWLSTQTTMSWPQRSVVDLIAKVTTNRWVV